VNTFTFNEVLVNKVLPTKNKKGINLSVLDRVDGKFVCSRLVNTNDQRLMKFITDNITSDGEFVVNITGKMTSTFSEQKNRWYDNLVATEISLA